MQRAADHCSSSVHWRSCSSTSFAAARCREGPRVAVRVHVDQPAEVPWSAFSAHRRRVVDLEHRRGHDAAAVAHPHLDLCVHPVRDAVRHGCSCATASQPAGPLTSSPVPARRPSPLRRRRSRIGLHCLRHSLVRLRAFIAHGESVKVVQRRLGHASAAITLDVYGHLWPFSDDRTGPPWRPPSRLLRTLCGQARRAMAAELRQRDGNALLLRLRVHRGRYDHRPGVDRGGRGGRAGVLRGVDRVRRVAGGRLGPIARTAQAPAARRSGVARPPAAARGSAALRDGRPATSSCGRGSRRTTTSRCASCGERCRPCPGLCRGSPGSCGNAGRTPGGHRFRRRRRTRTTRWPTPG